MSFPVIPFGALPGHVSGGGVADYPAEADVRDGVSYAFSGMEGSLVVPAASDVKKGVVFDIDTVGTYDPFSPTPGSDFDKSKDYLLQTVKTSVWYMQKTEEGDRVYTTDSVSLFQTRAKLIEYVVRESSTRTSPEMTQMQERTFHIWREPWLQQFTADRLPMLSDRLYSDGLFWQVTDVYFSDLDSSGFHQRMRVTCEASKRRPIA